MTDRLRERLGPTHRVDEIAEENEPGGDGAAGLDLDLDLSGLNEHERRLATREVRSPQSWLLCPPREGPNADLGGRG